MSESNGSNVSGSLLGVLFVILLILKLTGVITWSWWLVTLPLWFGLAVLLAVLVVGGLAVGSGAAIMALAHALRKGRR